VSQSSVVTLVRSEFKKISSTRLWWGLLFGAVAWTLLWAVLSAAFAGVDPGGGQETSPPLDTPEAIRSVYGAAAFTGAYIFALILGIAGMTGEYRYQTITPTFLVSPRRTGVVGAKMIAHLVMGVVFGVVGVLTAVAAGGATILIRGFELGLGLDGVWASIGLTVVAVAIWTLVGIGIGTLIRNQIAAILVSILYVFVGDPLIAGGLSLADVDGAVPYTPNNVSAAVVGAFAGFDLLTWWAGLLMLLAYGVLIALLGWAIGRRRDIA